MIDPRISSQMQYSTAVTKHIRFIIDIVYIYNFYEFKQNKISSISYMFCLYFSII